MRWFRSNSSHRLINVDIDAFEAAALEQGITLDQSQLAAASALADTDDNLYLWGPVGRGKSWLMATYFAALPTDRKLRVHFHEFFRDLHLAIKRHDYNLTAALDELLRDVDVVCFDEFHVHDPADGLLINRSLSELFNRQLRLILTSNYSTRSLMPNPLFHDTFIPTIELIEKSTTSLCVDGPVDYRTTSGHEAGFAAGWWVSPNTDQQRQQLGLRTPTPDEQHTVAPAGHPITVRRADDTSIWFTFADLCESTTAPADYIALAEQFRSWIISDIPDLRDAGSEPSQRFANVVDVLYDRDIQPTFLAAESLSTLTDSSRLPVDIDRITSRLGQLQQANTDSLPR